MRDINNEDAGTTVAVAIPVNGPGAPLSLIEMAVRSGSDPEYLKKLVDLQERREDRAARGEFAAALNACQSEIPAIYKDGRNKHNDTRYATLEAVLAVVQPVALRHGFALMFGQDEHAPPGELGVYLDVSHVAGHTQRVRGNFPVDVGGSGGKQNKTGIQGVGSAFSYARRYLLGLAFNLTFTTTINPGRRTDDTDGAPEVPTLRYVTKDEVAEIEQCIAECEAAGKPVDRDRLLKLLKVPSLADLTIDRAFAAVWRINHKRRGK